MSTGSQWTVDTLLALMDERDRRYAGEIRSIVDTATATALEGKTAVEKADAALKEYKASANEIRAALNDYQSRTMPRSEVESNLTSIRALIEAQTTIINSLLIAGGRGEGIVANAKESRSQANFVIGLLVSNGLTILILLYTIFKGAS